MENEDSIAELEKFRDELSGKESTIVALKKHLEVQISKYEKENFENAGKEVNLRNEFIKVSRYVLEVEAELAESKVVAQRRLEHINIMNTAIKKSKVDIGAQIGRAEGLRNIQQNSQDEMKGKETIIVDVTKQLKDEHFRYKKNIFENKIKEKDLKYQVYEKKNQKKEVEAVPFRYKTNFQICQKEVEKLETDIEMLESELQKKNEKIAEMKLSQEDLLDEKEETERQLRDEISEAVRQKLEVNTELIQSQTDYQVSQEEVQRLRHVTAILESSVKKHREEIEKLMKQNSLQKKSAHMTKQRSSPKNKTRGWFTSCFTRNSAVFRD